MVGRLSLQDVPDLPESKRRGDRGLDSPDSGLPPSPGSWLLSGGGSERALANGLPEEPAARPPPRSTSASPNPPLPGSASRLCPLSFGEGVEFDPLPPKDIRYTSSVKYDSEKHFINDVYMPMGLGVSSCSQTVICVPDSTWRSYKAEVHFEPRNKPRRFSSTTIVYPKHTKTVYTTTLDYNCKKFMRKFLSSVELESSGNDYSPDDF
ncbi:refilin-B [Tiliqua scincoides]|uniref:refilin-B n=1 Tax=Tiliqua scincoides TaxID=71010 RepID=UPI0034617FD3